MYKPPRIEHLKLPAFLIGLLLLCFNMLTLTHAAENSSSTGAVSLFDKENQVLSPDQAFKLTVSAQDKTTLEASFTVAPGHYLYRERIKFDTKDASISGVNFPKGDIKKTPTSAKWKSFTKAFMRRSS